MKRIAGLSEDKIIRIATSDNWSMGDTGLWSLLGDFL